MPDRGTFTEGTRAEFVVNESAPGTPPGEDGANVTGACSASPLARVTGNVTGTLVVLPLAVFAILRFLRVY